MRDLVESTIGQVLKQQPTMKPMAQQKTNDADANKTFHSTQVMQPLDIQDPEMWDACCQFESIFLQQMMEAMRKTVPESEFLPRGYANDMYDGMMDQAIAKSGSQNAPLGLAESMYRQLDRDGFTHNTMHQNQQGAQDIQSVADSLKTMGQASKPKLGGHYGSY